jgi:hypothetical protein
MPLAPSINWKVGPFSRVRKNSNPRIVYKRPPEMLVRATRTQSHQSEWSPCAMGPRGSARYEMGDASVVVLVETSVDVVVVMVVVVTVVVVVAT